MNETIIRLQSMKDWKTQGDENFIEEKPTNNSINKKREYQK